MMRNSVATITGACLVTAFVTVTASAVPADITPDFNELRALIQTNLPGVTGADIERKATEGLLQGFRGKVQLVESNDTVAATTNLITRSAVFDGGIAYLRVDRVDNHLSVALKQSCSALSKTNKTINGLVLDLRFADGNNYAAAAAAADLFMPYKRDLLDWGQGMVQSVAKTNAVLWPIVALVNGETTGASEALAVLLRESNNALILGGRTIGAAMTTKEFTLANGQRVRVATGPIKLGNGANFPATGLEPDIAVTVSPAEEKMYWNDPFGATVLTNMTSGITNRSTRRARTNEADLVRARKEGVELDDQFVRQRETEPEVPVIRDPALGRAVDLLKGLAVVRRER